MATQLSLPTSLAKTEWAILLAGLLALYAPTYYKLDQQVWHFVGQGHGPIILMLTLWLFWQKKDLLLKLPSQPAPVAGGQLFALGLLLYVVGSSQDVLILETASQIPLLCGIILIYWGKSGLRLLWFPIFFIIFLLPLPSFIVDGLTKPLKAGASIAAEQILYMAGYPIARSGVTLAIGPYHLLVADACAGLNSIFALEAIGVFYLSIMNHANKWRNITLALLILPISFISNVTRVITLVLITYYFGDEIAQGFVHDFAGILLFMVATVLTVGTDTLLGFFFKEKSAGAAAVPVESALSRNQPLESTK